MKKNHLKSLFIICLTLCCLGCSNLTGSSSEKGYIYHVVIAWLKDPGATDGQQALIDGTKSLKESPGVVAISAGRTFPSDRNVVDDSFDVALTIVLKDQQALATYQNHPIHNRVKKEVLKPLVARYLVYNYVD